MIKPLKKISRELLRKATREQVELLNRQLLLNGKIASLQLRQIETIDSLAEVEFKVYSQFGEDGILEWLIHKLAIEHRSFIEIGVGPNESNTRFLLHNRNWRGLIIDGDENVISAIRSDNAYWQSNLSAQTAFVTGENVNDVFAKNGMQGDIGLLSIDINGNDYWLCEAITVVRPIIWVCEFNSTFGDAKPIVVPYEPGFEREKAHDSHLYWGASIGALKHLLDRKGYELVGTNSAGLNAFFVRKDRMESLRTSIRNTAPAASFLKAGGWANGRPALNLVGPARAEPIAAMPVVDLTTGETKTIGELRPLFSDEWLRQLGIGKTR